MEKKKLFIIVYIVLIIVLNFPINIRESKADVIDVYSTGAGNFLPVEKVPLIMTNASVIFNCDARTYRSKINIDFKGNYTIYNPSESQNATLGKISS